MKLSPGCVLVAVIATQFLDGCNASYEWVAHYLPESKVTDENAIDLDMLTMKVALTAKTPSGLQTARDVYEMGAFSKSAARLTLNDGGLDKAVPAGTVAISNSTSDKTVRGTTAEDYEEGATEIEVIYDTPEIQNAYSQCQVGANPEPVIDRCFADSENMMLEGYDTISYEYDVLKDNINLRTLQSFSTKAKELLNDCVNCPYPDYKKFVDYYAEFDYADQWVSSAFQSQPTNFANGNADFTTYGFDGQVEAVQKGVLFMGVWMFVIRQMEAAIDECSSCVGSTCGVNTWDVAVAYYSGSQVDQFGTQKGDMLFALADERCIGFRTCGDTASETSGMSHVNHQVYRLFKNGQIYLNTKRCQELTETKEQIVNFMKIPLIQGTLRYAHITNYEIQYLKKHEAEGAAYAASILPLIYGCNSEDAETIYNNLRVGQNGKADFPTVKAALERNYECLGVTCAGVGGLYTLANGGVYEDGAKPCVDDSTRVPSWNKRGPSHRDGILILGLSIGGIVVGTMIFLIVSVCCKQTKLATPPDLVENREDVVLVIEMSSLYRDFPLVES